MFLKTRYHAPVASLAAGIAALTLAGGASADVPNCADLNLPHPIYGVGGSAVVADIQQVATALAKLSSPITLLYSSQSACTGFGQFVNNKVTAVFSYWDNTGATLSCNPDSITGQVPDFAHMGNPATSCNSVTVPADVKDFPAPVQTVNVVVPSGFTTSGFPFSISAEALYEIYGFGADGKVAPWSTPAHLYQRGSSAFTQLLLGAVINLPPAKFQGTTGKLNSDIINDLVAAAATSTSDPIGFVSGSAADTSTDVKTLAFQAKGQTCGYWPDSGPGAKDKINVRTGQYALWSPGHFFAHAGGDGKPTNADVANLIGWYEGTVPGPDTVDVVGLTIDAGDIPQCAMQVTRDGLAGAISSAKAPGGACSHFFEKRATGATTGKACPGGDNDCKANGNELTCHHGYCEAY
jgi:hypothetical protein